MNSAHAVAAILIMVVVTALLRFTPFLLIGNRQPSKLISYLGKVLPYAIMGMLVVYCLKDIRFTAAESFLPQLLAGAVVVLLHIWKRNTLISIIGGTVSYMFLIQVAVPFLK